MAEQKSQDWFRQRLGKFNGSEIHSLMTTGRKKDEVFGETAKTYLYKIAAERMLDPNFLTDETKFQEFLNLISVSSKYTIWGEDMEQLAREYFMAKTGYEMEIVGSCTHPTIPNYAASPDGIFYKDGKKYVWENKAPKIETFVEYHNCIHDWESLKATKKEYFWQLNAEIDCTDADGACFHIFNPYLKKPAIYLFLERNEEYIKQIHERIELAENFISNLF